MRVDHFTIGIVCSGNTCRSPVTAAWLKQRLLQDGKVDEVTVWTAGLSLGESSQVHEEPKAVALEMGLDPLFLAELEGHRARPISAESRRTDLLVWITDPLDVSKIDQQGGLPRAERMRQIARQLDATLLVVPEQDKAWEAKKQGRDAFSAYKAQALALQQWAQVIYGFVPAKPIQAGKA